MDRKQIKIDAKYAVKGFQWLKFDIAIFIWAIVGGLINVVMGILMGLDTALYKKISIAGLVVGIVIGLFWIIISVGFMGCMVVGMYKNCIDMWYGTGCEIGTCFKYTKYLVNCFGIMWGMTWRLMIPIPILNIYLAMRCCFAPFVKAEYPYMKARFCIKRSKELTKNNVFNIFILGLSFFGWFLLAPLTLNLLMLWLMPYYLTAFAGAYDTLKQENGDVVAGGQFNPNQEEV